MYMYTGIHTNKFMRKRLGALVLVAGVTQKKKKRLSKESLSTTIHISYVHNI